MNTLTENELTDEKRFLLYKKIATRFLKELGVYHPFLEYIHKIKIVNTWYKRTDIDSIFGRIFFTDFLRLNKHYYLGYSISVIFRTYIIHKYPHKFRLKHEKKFINDCLLPDELKKIL